MESPISIIAGKEIRDAFRDRRSLASSLLYTLMGPMIVGLLTLTRSTSANAAESGTVLAMSSLFLLLSTFTGGMNIAMDTLAGERERRSLVPLLMNPLSQLQLIAGKWISIAAFSLLALLLSLIGFAIVIGFVLPTRFAELARLPLVASLLLAMLPLALLAAAAELAISTICRSVKEAHTWLAFLIFVPMGLGMFVAFHPSTSGEWAYAVPVLGQQVLLSHLVAGKTPPLSHTLVLCAVTIVSMLSLLRVTSRILQRDEVLYGN